MKCTRRVVVLSLAALVMGALTSMVQAEDPTFRDLVRKHIATQAAGGEPQTIPGLPASFQKIVALEYTVLLRKNGQDEAVDSNEYPFSLGDQIRVRIKPLNGLYIYIFHEGASGHRTCLLPMDKEMPPLARQDQSLDLPSDGSVFEFSPPAGEEKLIVVAVEEPSDDLAALSDVVFKKPDEQLTPAEKALQDKLKAQSTKTLKSIRERQAQGTRYRGLVTAEAMAKVNQAVERDRSERATLEEPPGTKYRSTFSMAASTKGVKPVELFVTIPLKSVAPKASTAK